MILLILAFSEHALSQLVFMSSNPETAAGSSSLKTLGLKGEPETLGALDEEPRNQELQSDSAEDR